MLCSHEFAKMLCYLHDNKLVDSHIRDYVSKWLVTLLTNENSSIATAFPVITKKIRDEILDTPTKYVRRSSFYMVIKVLLQHSLTCELGQESGKLLYKIIMLKFIADQCCGLVSITPLNIELTTQVLAKLARRIEKIESTDTDEFKDFKKSIIDSTCSIVHDSRLKIDGHTEQLQSYYKNQSKLRPLISVNFEKDIIQRAASQSNSKLRIHLNHRKNECITNYDSNHNWINLKAYKRYYTDRGDLKKYPISDVVIGDNDFENNLIISEFENCILYDFDIGDAFYFESNELRSMCNGYLVCVNKSDKIDPLAYSKTMLVTLKIIAMLDKKATSAYPMLLEHQTGINPSIFNYLLLPSQIDMQIAYDLEMHFQRRNEKATHPSLIEENEVTAESFSAKFGATNLKMQKFLREFKATDERNIARKQQQWIECRKKVEGLRNKLTDLSHTFNTIYRKEQVHASDCMRCNPEKCANKNTEDDDGFVMVGQFSSSIRQHKFVTNVTEEKVHKEGQCKYCQIEREIKNCKVTVYECLLPDNSDAQNAVAFEYNIPDLVACLRDSLHTFAMWTAQRRGEPLTIHNNWVNILNKNGPNTNILKNNVQLASTTVSAFDKQLHVDNDFEQFIVNSGLNCVYHSNKCEMIAKTDDSSIKRKCTFSVEDDSKYVCLKWTLNGTAHTQNEVLARQMECVPDLSLSEFKNFGSLRADGHRLQWRKLYAMIESEALSFDNSSVLSLIMQTIWETGRSGEIGSIRESHEDLKCIKFSRAMISLLDRYIDRQKSNWSHPLKLLMVVLISVRVFEMNEDAEWAKQIAAFLHKLRTVALDWINKNQRAIQELQSLDQLNEEKLRTNLIFIAIAGATTFYVHRGHKFFNEIFLTNPASFRMWLEFVVPLNNNILLRQPKQKQRKHSQQHLQMLLQMVYSIGTHIEPTLRAHFKDNPNDIYNFIKKLWIRFGRFIKVRSHVECRNILVIDCKRKTGLNKVRIDLINGTFLVNNSPICRLRKEITQNELFKSVFENFLFEVQPDTENGFITIHEYNGSRFEFIQTNSGIDPIIIERKANGIEIELMPKCIFSNDIPPLLIESYSHWWNKQTNTIEFRPKLFNSINFSTHIEYQLDLNANHLLHIPTNRFMMDIESSSYKNIVDQLSRLEQSKFIHIFLDEAKVVKIELIRMQLKFKIDADNGYNILSNEFSNMRISSEQNFGTLFGLNHGLLLEEVDGCSGSQTTKILLLPHGKVRTTRYKLHVSVDIDLKSDVRTPPWHSYQVDEICRQLKPISGRYDSVFNIKWHFFSFMFFPFAVIRRGFILHICMLLHRTVKLSHSLVCPAVSERCKYCNQIMCGHRLHTTMNRCTCLENLKS